MRNSKLPKYLYHYTKLDSFLKIWETQTLLFGNSNTTNDIFERQKIVGANKAYLPIIGEPKTELELLQNFFQELYKHINQYRQISLTVGRENNPKGFDIPMMWGHYARAKVDNTGEWQDGVCIELDSEKLNLTDQNCLYRQVKYTNDLPTINFDGYNFVEGSIDDFIKLHLLNLFFKKHTSWKFEREFRLITNDSTLTALPINGAISAVYFPQYDSETMQRIEDVVNDDTLLWYLINNYAKGERHLSRYNVNKRRKFEKGGYLLIFDGLP